MSTKVKITPAKPSGNVPLGTLSINLTVREATSEGRYSVAYIDIEKENVERLR